MSLGWDEGLSVPTDGGRVDRGRIRGPGPGSGDTPEVGRHPDIQYISNKGGHKED